MDIQQEGRTVFSLIKIKLRREVTKPKHQNQLTTNHKNQLDFHGLENDATLMTVPQLQIQTVHSKTDLPL